MREALGPDRVTAVAIPSRYTDPRSTTCARELAQALGLTKRNKRNFHAQEMLVLLAQLARNLITWTRMEMARHVPSWQAFGSLRMV